MNRYCCFSLVIVFAIAVGPLTAEAQGLPPGSGEAFANAIANAFKLENLLRFYCGIGFVEFAFIGCLLTCFMPPRRRRRR